MNVSALGGVDLSSQVSVAVARKTLDAAERQGDALVGLIREAARVGAEARGRIAAEPGPGETGRRLDVSA